MNTPLNTLLGCAFALIVSALCPPSVTAEDWGTYSIIPVSAPLLALESAAPGNTAGTALRLGNASRQDTQKWTISVREGEFLTLRVASNPTLVLSVSRGSTQNGAALVLEPDSGQPWQEWRLTKLEGGNYCITPRHAPDKGMDDFGGNKAPGAKVDLWVNAPGDPHLQWIIQPLAGSLTAANPTPAHKVEGYTPPVLDPSQVSPGSIQKCRFTSSKIFPGTVRDVTVFVPAQYDGSKPACVYLKMDGYNPKEKGLLEDLIAAKEMPVTVGVFVTPGTLPSPEPNTLGRRNRCLEYDGVSADTARFFLEELLPFVAAEFHLNLSKSGNDRCLAGGSSGGIAAFNAAWQRPESFSRVYANSGSFVAFRGGHEFPTLVRKTEAKPIRAYLTTGTRDMENCAGDWFLIDQEMDKALRFSGYDYFFRSINGGHVAGYYDYFREAMSYLWKDWPKPVQAGPSAPRAQDVLLPGEGWQLVAENLDGASAATCSPSGDVFFIETGTDKIRCIKTDGSISDFAPSAGKVSGISTQADGSLVTVSKSSGLLSRFNAQGEPHVLLSGIPGEHIQAHVGGALYISNSAAQTSLWMVKDGLKTPLDIGFKSASGIAIRPDQWLLSVADSGSKWAYSYQINPDGTLSNKERFFWLHVADWDDDAGAQAVCYASEGQMCVATRMGVQICADDGPTQVILPMPDHCRVLGLCFGGPDLDTLFAFTGDKIWKRKVKIHASTAFTPKTKVNATKL